LPPLAIALASALVVAGSYTTGLFVGFETILEDLAFGEKQLDTRLLIVAIDNDALRYAGQWPWPRATQAELLQTIARGNPLAIGLDVIPADPSRLGGVDDAVLRKTLSGLTRPIVLPVEMVPLYLAPVPRGEQVITPLPLFFGKDFPQVHLGHVNLIADRDGRVRRVPGMVQVGAMSYPSFAARLSQLAGSGISSSPRSQIERIVYTGASGTVPRVSAAKVLARDPATLALLKGRIVLVGATASDLHDEQSTPVDRGTSMSGVEIQAQVVNMLLRDYRLVSLPAPQMLLLLLLAALISALIFWLFARSLTAVVVSVVMGLLYVPITLILFDRGIVLNLVHLELASMCSTAALFAHRYLTIERDRRQMRSAFSKYVSKDVLEEILANPAMVKLGGEEKEATVFFSDVRGFTTLSETLTPTQLVEFLNKYLSRMTDIMLAERGVVDKYIGDAIMGFWGAPIQTTTHALDAVRTALSMVEALLEFNASSKAAGEPEIDIGIGLNTGKVTAGNMGSSQRFDYTVMGDTVNLASRLEGQTKSYAIHILISESTYAALPKELLEKENILVRELDQIKVKGKKLPVRVYQVVDRSKMEVVRMILDKFAQLREQYCRGAWGTCIQLAEEILRHVDDGPTKTLLERARYFTEHPPEHWEGVYELKTK